MLDLILFNDSNPFNDSTHQFVNICQIFNEFCVTLFIYFKYIFVILLIFFGISTLLNYRFFKAEIKKHYKDYREKDFFFNKLRLIFGIFSLFAAFGILFNYFLYFLILLLEPLPDQYLFTLLNSAIYQDKFLTDFNDLSKYKDLLSKSLYNLFALGSFEANLRIVTICYILLSRRNKIIMPNKAAIILVEALIQALLLGFTTYIKLFI